MFCTTFVNLVLALLVLLRLLYYQRFISKTLGAAHGSPYLRVISMCVESCGLIVVMSTTNIVMIITNNITYLIPFMLLPHICVISPLLIVYQVAIGRSANAKRPSNLTAEGGSPTHQTTVRFNHPMSTVASRGDFHEESEETHGATATEDIEMKAKWAAEMLEGNNCGMAFTNRSLGTFGATAITSSSLLSARDLVFLESPLFYPSWNWHSQFQGYLRVLPWYLGAPVVNSVLWSPKLKVTFEIAEWRYILEIRCLLSIKYIQESGFGRKYFCHGRVERKKVLGWHEDALGD